MEINLYSQINEESFDKIKTAYWSGVEKGCLLSEVLEDILNLVETDQV